MPPGFIFGGDGYPPLIAGGPGGAYAPAPPPIGGGGAAPPPPTDAPHMLQSVSVSLSIH